MALDINTGYNNAFKTFVDFAEQAQKHGHDAAAALCTSEKIFESRSARRLKLWDNGTRNDNARVREVGGKNGRDETETESLLRDVVQELSERRQNAIHFKRYILHSQRRLVAHHARRVALRVSVFELQTNNFNKPPVRATTK